MRPNPTLLAAALLLSTCSLAQTTFSTAGAPPDAPIRQWNASWITHPTAPLRDPVVLHFRRTVTLLAAPSKYVVRVSADNRFILWVNGNRVGDGPARSDLTHWRYERFDIAPLLKPGQNLITATVWNFGILAPLAQITDRTAFLLESEAQGETGISTPTGWQVELEPGQAPLPRSALSYTTYYASGPGEKIDAAHYDWDWDSPSVANSNWVQPGDPMRDSAFPGTNHAHSSDVTGDNPWGLVPDYLPPMEFTSTDPGKVVRAATPAPFPASLQTVPANQHVHILLDRSTLTTAYPQLTVSGGAGAKIILTYSEALYDKEKNKADRNLVDDRTALGITDHFLPDGGQHRTFQPLWWRTWRYLDLDITTANQPLTLESLKAQFTAYPFQELGSFHSPDPDLSKIWEISWRTARLDAHETYMDTPYYEQLQYIGDTRIQALISYSIGGDDRLARQALESFNSSRIPEGITRSRYPSSLPQNIPTFSLLWVGMLHDWWMYRPDPAPVRESMQGTRSVLAWFGQYERPDGLLEKLPWWSFIDWVNKGETPTYSKDGESCITTLEYLGALDQAADLEQALGDPAQAQHHRDRASHVRSGLASKCWVADRGLLADNPDHTVFSQQANILAVLYDVIPKASQQNVLRRISSIQPGTTPDGVLSASYYFRFYLSRALDHAGMADSYLDTLAPWRSMLALHFSTWPETPEPTRSDSHAWSAHPAYDLLTLVAGIQPASPGFRTVRIAPHLGSLPEASATFPHPQGPIQVQYRKTAGGIDATIHLPGTLTGEFVFAGKSQPLHPGANHFPAESR